MAIATYAPTRADRRYARRDAANERQQQRAHEREQRNAEAQAAAERAGYPAMDGTEAQARWSVTIRHAFALNAADRISDALARNDPDAQAMVDALDAALTVTDASWWIDTRNGVRVPFEDHGAVWFELIDLLTVAVMARKRCNG